MLAKLLKYEIKATSRTFLPLYGVLLVFAAISKLFIAVNDNSTVMKIFTALGTVAYVFVIIIIFALTLIVMIQRFYKNLLGDEGYLMFTLPAKVWTHIVTKLVVSMMWVVLSLIFTLLSVLIVAADKELYSHIVLGVNEAVAQLSRYGLNAGGLLAEIIVVFLVGIITSILMIYAAVTIGHLFNSHKILASFGAFLGLNMVSQALSSVVILVGSAVNPGILSEQSLSRQLPQFTLISSLCISLVFAAAYFIITNYLLTRRLNLE